VLYLLTTIGVAIADSIAGRTDPFFDEATLTDPRPRRC
jgi:hypothetical protein